MSDLETRDLNEGVIQGNSASVREVICNCLAFVATTLVVIGELFNEHNLWGVVIVGGALSTVNILVTSVGLERARQVSGVDIDVDGKSVRRMQPSRDVIVQFEDDVIQRVIEREENEGDDDNEGEERGEGKEEEEEKKMKMRRKRVEREKRRRSRKEEGKPRKSSRLRDKFDMREKKERRVRKRRVEGFPAPENRGLYTVLNI